MFISSVCKSPVTDGGKGRSGTGASHGTFAGFPVRDGLGQVSVVALLAVVAVASGAVVAAVEANASALPPRQLVQLHVEATSPGMKVTVTRWEGGEKRGGGGVIFRQIIRWAWTAKTAGPFTWSLVCD